MTAQRASARAAGPATANEPLDRTLLAAACALALAGCAETDALCDEGFARDSDGECVPPDGGPADAGPDAPTDALCDEGVRRPGAAVP